MAKEEVKDTEEHTFEDISDDEKPEIPGPASEEEKSEESEEKPESSSGEEGEESKEESEEETEEKTPAPSQPKPVEGETPRERALRLEVQRLKGQRREAKLAEEKKPEVDRMKELEEDYTPEELTKMERAIDVLATKAGYTKQSVVQQNAANDTLQDFLDENTEYAPQNDVEDVHWNAFQRILASDYNIKNKSARQLKTIFNKVHRDVNEELGIVEDKPVRNQKKIDAANQKIQSVSHAGGTKTKPTESSGDHLKNMESANRKMFKGFSEDDFKE